MRDTSRIRDRLRRVPAHLAPAPPAEEPCGARVQQLQVIGKFGHRPDRRARSPHRVGLVDRNRRRDPLDPVDLRAVHPLEELAGVGGEHLDVPPLPLGVDGVERERRLARPAHPGDDRGSPIGKRTVTFLRVFCRAPSTRMVFFDLLIAGFSRPMIPPGWEWARSTGEFDSHDCGAGTSDSL